MKIPPSLCKLFNRAANDPGLLLRFGIGAGWSAVGAALFNGTTLLVTIIAARILGRDEYGRLSLILNTVVTFAVIAGLGLGVTATKYVSEYRGVAPQKTKSVVALTLLFSLVSAMISGLALYASADYVAVVWLHADTLANPLRIGSVLLFLTSVAASIQSALGGFEAYSTIAGINAGRAVVLLPLGLMLCRVSGLNGVLIAMVLAALAAASMGLIALFRRVDLTGIKTALSSINAFGLILRFSLPSFLINALVWPTTWWVLARVAANPGGFGEIAILNVGLQWRNILTMVPTILSQPALPILSSLLAKGLTRDHRRFLQFNVAVMVGGTLLFAIITCTLSPVILSYYGAAFRGGENVFIITVLTSILMVASSTLGQGLTSSGRMWVVFAVHLAWAGTLLGMTGVSAHQRASSVAIAFLSAYAVQAALLATLDRYYRTAGEEDTTLCASVISRRRTLSTVFQSPSD